MRTLAIVFVLAIVHAASCLQAEAAEDATLTKVPNDKYRTESANGTDKAGEPVYESPDDECGAAGPENFGPERRQTQCLPCLSCRPCPCLYGEVEALFLEQVPLSQNRPIVVDANTGATFLSTSDLDSGFDPGLRAMFGVRLCNGLAVEFGYFGLSQAGFTLTEKPDDTSYLIFANNFAGNVFVNMDRVQANYSSSVNSFEMNFPCCCGCCTRCGDCGCGETTCAECGCVKAACGGVRCSSLEWFAGVRFLDIGNVLNIAVERRENGGVEDGSYNIQTGNHLIGGQLGARLRRTINRFGWEVTGKAGVYARTMRNRPNP